VKVRLLLQRLLLLLRRRRLLNHSLSKEALGETEELVAQDRREAIQGIRLCLFEELEVSQTRDAKVFQVLVGSLEPVVRQPL
jgi:hypothetical protein